MQLPIDQILPKIKKSLLQQTSLLLMAPPGSGKSTRVPPALLTFGKVLLLQPRRAAARLIAERISSELGSKIGQKVGYHIRFERRFQKETQLIVLTEGMLLRWMQSDPFLDDVAVVILDEFHERSMQQDILLAMLYQIQQLRGTELPLKMVLMSATLDPQPLVRYLGDNCASITAQGRQFPITLSYDRYLDQAPLAVRCAQRIRQELHNPIDGDILVFLPGVYEITKTKDLLTDITSWQILPLHGKLSLQDQQKALTSGPTPKIILATNIAETSLTLPNVSLVIDSGVQRSAVHVHGYTQLRSELISLDSATQRSGRAGRVRAGRCHRMWTQHAEQSFSPSRIPQIVRTELTESLLQILAWGGDIHEFPWLQEPPQAHFNSAVNLLTQLQAIDEQYNLTEEGKRLARLPLHPRQGKMMLIADQYGCTQAAAAVCALLNEKDPFGPLDLLDKVDRFERSGCPRNLKRAQRQITAFFSPSSAPKDEHALQVALMAGFPDRVGRRRENSRRYLLADGQEAELPRNHPALGEWVIAPALYQNEAQQRRIGLATEIDPRLLQTTERSQHEWQNERVVHKKITHFGALVLQQQSMPVILEKAAPILFKQAIKHPIHALKPSKESLHLCSRIAFLRRQQDAINLPALDEWQTLLETLCDGKKSYAELQQTDLAKHIVSQLSWPQQKQLQKQAPASLRVPSGTQVRIQYPEHGAPILAARIQQLFGMEQTPVLAGQKLMIHLLAPNGRPQQQTTDLASFWKNTYPQIRKDLRGRYAKHAWPEAPTAADAENSPRRRKK